jgi:hypothetical protein
MLGGPMSADAKVWQDSRNDGWVSWRGTHDGPCVDEALPHDQGDDLLGVLRGIHECFGGKRLRWEFRNYPDGTIGLVGYEA